MAYKIPLWLLGKHVQTLTITPMSVGTDGALTAVTGSAVAAVRLRTRFDFQISPQDEEINDDGSTVANHVLLADDFTLSIDLLGVADGNEPFKMNNLIGTYNYFKVVTVFTKGGSTKTLTVVGTRGDLGANSNGRGAFKEALNLKCADTGTGSDAPLVWS